jgi:hypothetical protein
MPDREKQERVLPRAFDGNWPIWLACRLIRSLLISGSTSDFGDRCRPQLLEPVTSYTRFSRRAILRA